MPLVQNPSIGAGAAPMLTTTTLLSSAQILGLNSSFVPLTPSPGAGNLIVPVVALLSYKFGTEPYVTTEDGLDIIYNSPNEDNAYLNVAGLLTMAASSFVFAPPAALTVYTPTSEDAGVALVLSAFGAGFGLGPIVTATLGAGGLGYLANDTGTITNGANDATYKVLTVGAGGAVLTFQITGAGTACSVANGNATVDGGAQPGVGVGFTVNITAVQTGDGTLKVVTYYQIIPVP